MHGGNGNDILKGGLGNDLNGGGGIDIDCLYELSCKFIIQVMSMYAQDTGHGLDNIFAYDREYYFWFCKHTLQGQWLDNVLDMSGQISCIVMVMTF